MQPSPSRFLRVPINDPESRVHSHSWAPACRPHTQGTHIKYEYNNFSWRNFSNCQLTEVLYYYRKRTKQSKAKRKHSIWRKLIFKSHYWIQWASQVFLLVRQWLGVGDRLLNTEYLTVDCPCWLHNRLIKSASFSHLFSNLGAPEVHKVFFFAVDKHGMVRKWAANYWCLGLSRVRRQ